MGGLAPWITIIYFFSFSESWGQIGTHTLLTSFSC